jgi:toxin-antitoxin system PIN domain toxin
MTIVDANLLLYAYNADAPQQPAAAHWLQELLKTGENIGLPWITLWAFVRIATNNRIWPNPLSPDQAFTIVQQWLAQPGVIILEPGPRHVELLKRIANEYSVTGPLMTDAVLAALALENGATLASTDQGFRRFTELRWTNPLARP